MGSRLKCEQSAPAGGLPPAAEPCRRVTLKSLYRLEGCRPYEDWDMPLETGNLASRRRSPMKLNRITMNPARMNGQPCIRDLRLTVRRVVELAALYPDRAELRKEFPELQDEDIRQALQYAANCLDDRIIELPMNYETAA